MVQAHIGLAVELNTPVRIRRLPQRQQEVAIGHKGRGVAGALSGKGPAKALDKEVPGGVQVANRQSEMIDSQR